MAIPGFPTAPGLQGVKCTFSTIHCLIRSWPEQRYYSSMMPPPPAPYGVSSQSRVTLTDLPQGYPQIAVPSSWGGSLSMPPPSSALAGTPSGSQYPKGYSVAHLHYQSQRSAWASKAYQSTPAETIGILMQVLREVPGKLGGVSVQVFCSFVILLVGH